MRAVRLEAPGPPGAGGRLVAVDLPDPEPGPGQVLVEVAACAVCRTDLQIVSGDLPARRMPVVPGHQVVGRVAAVGDGVDAARVGRSVGVTWLAGSCGTCRYCRSGRENLCPTAAFTGWDVDGGFAELVVARADVAVDLPDLGPAYGDGGRAGGPAAGGPRVAAVVGAPGGTGGSGAPGGAAAPGGGPGASRAAAVAPLLCGGVVGYRALRATGLGPSDAGARLGLFGFGASATVVVQVAAHWGLEAYVVTRSAAEADRALALGAAWAGTYDEPLPVGLDAAVTFAPVGWVVVAALRALDPGGTVVVNAIYLDGGVPGFAYGDLWLERSIRSVANVTRADAAELLALVPAAGIRTEHEVLPLSAADEALRRLAAGDVRGAFVLVP